MYFVVIERKKNFKKRIICIKALKERMEERKKQDLERDEM